MQGFELRIEDKPWSIHSIQSQRFMREVIGAGTWHQQLLERGLELEFTSDPVAYREENNKSAVSHLDLVREKLKVWLESDSIEELEKPAWCTNPLSVAAKYDPVNDKVKYRPVIDLSRHVNLHVLKSHTKLDDLQASEVLVDRGDFLCSFDMENQFFHVRLAPEHRKYFGFAVPDEMGKTRFYQFKVMAYGYGPAVSVVTRLLQPVKAFLHKLGIKVSLYVDDGRISASSKEGAEQQLEFSLQVLQLCGWNIQWLKTFILAEQQHLHLGFITDTVAMMYFYPEVKWDLFMKLLTELVAKVRQGDWCEAKEWASFLGKLQSMKRSHGDIVGVMSRSCQHAVGKAVVERGWSTRVRATGDCLSELLFLQVHLSKFHGQHLQESGPGKVFELDRTERELQLARDQKVGPGFWEKLAGVEEKSYVLKTDGLVKQVREVGFEVDSKDNRGMEELKVAGMVLLREKEQLVQGGHRKIYWQTGSYGCAVYLKRGSKIPEVQREVVKIKWLEKELGCSVVGVWAPKDSGRIRAAEIGQLSSQSTDEWGIERGELCKVLAGLKFQPEVDCMATRTSTVCGKFFAAQPQQGVAGVDFFCQELEPGVNYFCCPPVKMAFQAAQQLVSKQGISSVLVLPVWTSSPFWSGLQADQRFQKAIVKQIRCRPKFLVFNRSDGLFGRSPKIEMIFFKLFSGTF